MKKLIQIFLIVLLVSVFMQATAGGTLTTSSQIGVRQVSHALSEESMSAEGAQMAACLVNKKGRICYTPDVGWNS